RALEPRDGKRHRGDVEALHDEDASEEDQRGEAAGGGHANTPLPGGEGVGGWGSAAPPRVDASVEHPHPALPLKGEGGRVLSLRISMTFIPPTGSACGTAPCGTPPRPARSHRP